ncbi:LPXTG cell wall anchor domain-containing protein [Dactylosporangium sp. CA-139066]|uniref:LPXTG cell wall anchor domain-containing protein n=1 Tax=Dactylosporangium sp. CA-139066 TaxID=3239930 RepID=UPI003D90A12E
MVDVRLVVKNNGPSAAWGFAVGLSAPEGTEFVGPAVEQCWTPPRTDMVCKPTGFVKPGQAYEQTFQLKFKWAGARPGTVSVTDNWQQGPDPDPYFHIVDPDTSNNTAEFHVTLGSSAPHPSASATAGEPLPVTGTSVTLYVAVGAALALAGAVLLALVRRRRVRFAAE